MSNNTIRVNKLTDKQKKTFNSRGKTSILVVLYTLSICAFGLLACTNNPWFELNKYAHLSFAVILIVVLLPIYIIGVIELTNCCLKQRNRFELLTSTTLGVIATLGSEIILSLYKYDCFSFANFISIYLCVLLIPLAILFVVSFVLTITKKEKRFNIITYPIFLLLISFTFVTIYYLLIIKLFTTFFFLIAVTWLTDSCAYLGGSFFGKHKMCPKISPNKTWEGFGISVILALLVLSSLLGLYTLDKHVMLSMFGSFEINQNTVFDCEWKWWLVVVPLAAILIICNTCGDLFFSQIKRKNDIKDFSNLLPGHGGILDRIDALIFIVISYILLTFITSLCFDQSLELFFNGYPLAML